MEEDCKPPLLLEYMFGKSVEAAQRAATDRILTWAEAFDEWLAELGAKYTQSTTKQVGGGCCRWVRTKFNIRNIAQAQNHSLLAARIPPVGC